VLESMASGTPVIASDLPVVRELMEDGVQGLLVPPDRPGELARAIRTLVDLPDRAEAMGTAGRERIRERFLWSASVAALESVYASLQPGFMRAMSAEAVT
jgi:glycosyltransferase involved in cell wall biosynthesis